MGADPAVEHLTAVGKRSGTTAGLASLTMGSRGQAQRYREKAQAEAAPGCWVGVACKHTLGYRLVPPCPWGTASRTPCSYRNPPDTQGLGCSSAVFAQSLMAQTSGIKCPSSRAGAV